MGRALKHLSSTYFVIEFFNFITNAPRLLENSVSFLRCAYMLWLIFLTSGKLYISVKQFFPHFFILTIAVYHSINLSLRVSTFPSEHFCFIFFFFFSKRIIIIACKYLSLLSKRAPSFCCLYLKCNQLSNYDETSPFVAARISFFSCFSTHKYTLLSVFHNSVRSAYLSGKKGETRNHSNTLALLALSHFKEVKSHFVCQ